MNPILLGVIAFVAGLGISVGVVMSRPPAAPPATAAADSTAADSLGHAEPEVAAGAETAHAAPAAATAAPTALDTAAAHAAHPGTAGTEDSSETPGAEPVLTTEQLEKRAQLYKRVSRILVAMKPKEAAEIMNRLDNQQLDAVFRALDARKAAALLAQLPPERAAELSRRMLEPTAEVNP